MGRLGSLHTLKIEVVRLQVSPGLEGDPGDEAKSTVCLGMLETAIGKDRW